MDWRVYAVKRIGLIFPILFAVSILIFGLIHMIPGSPAYAILGIRASPEAIAALEQELGLDRPIYIQYIDWLVGVLQGDFGTSYTHDAPVSSLLAGRFLVTLQLVVYTMLIAPLLSIPLGVAAALRQNSRSDYAIMSIGIIGLSVPIFFAAVLLQAIFAVNIDIFPVSGYVPMREDLGAHLHHMVLPVLSLVFVQIAITLRMVRSSMIETISQEFVRFHRSKGLPERVILFRHALKNSFIPVVTMLGLQFGYLLAAAVVVEFIFSIPGLGRTIVNAVLQRDIPLVQGVLLVMALWFAVVNLVTDLAVAALDPRIMDNE